MSGPRIFCLGFNKTGTTSLHRFFLGAGLSAFHSTLWPAWSHLPKGRAQFARWQAYSDGEGADFKALHQWFPRAVFVLNTRDPGAWLASRIKHVMRYGHPDTFGADGPPAPLGDMADAFFANPALAIDAWLASRALYHARARSYFADHPGFLELDVTTQPDWGLVLTRHLSSAGVVLAPESGAEPPHANPRDHDAIPDPARLATYLELALNRLTAFEATHGPQS